MTSRFADTLFRIAFVAAGVYNLVFGAWAAVWPHSFFELFELSPPSYPGIWACLGMVVGVYGLLYLYAARRLDRAGPIIAVGLLGKILGPIGMWLAIGDDWPRRLGMLCVFNDLIWWLPFALFLVRGTPTGRRLVALAPWLCVATHVLAIVALTAVLRHAALTVPDLSSRAQFVAANPTAWSLGWATWMLAAASLVAFYAWWGSRLDAHWLAIAAVVITAVGMVCDFAGESLLALPLVERAALAGEEPEAFGHIERTFTLLSAGAANGLYTLGGIILTLATPGLPRGVRWSMWGTWLAGAAMTVAAVMNSVAGLVVSTVVLFPLLLSWMVWMALRGRPA